MIVPNFLLLGVVAYAHADVIVTAITPYVEGKLEARDEDALVYLSSSVAEGVLAWKG